MPDLVGQQLGNYRISRKLGSGAFADVYLAEHIYLSTRVAIKVLRDKLTAKLQQRLLDEARLLQELDHPNIVRLYDFGIQNGITYLVMQYAPNGSLDEKHKTGEQLPLNVVVSYTKRAAAGLQCAHNKKYIHCDVKPENILLGGNDEILLSDFGIATIAHQTRSLTTGEPIGSVRYMAPEQLNGKPRPASDQYSLGVCVYLWLTGQLPFEGSFMEIVMQHLQKSPPLLQTRVPNLPIAVQEVVLRSLAKEAKDRFPDIVAFASALESASNAPSRIAIPRPPVSPPMPHNQPAPVSFLGSQKNGEQWLAEGNVCYREGKYREAIYACDQAIRLHYNLTLAYNFRGKAYLGVRAFQRAIDDFDQALSFNNRYPSAYRGRGKAYIALGDATGDANYYWKALDDYNAAIALENHDSAFFYRGYAYFKLAKYEQAIQDCGIALKMNQHYEAARRLRDKAYKLRYPGH